MHFRRTPAVCVGGLHRVVRPLQAARMGGRCERAHSARMARGQRHRRHALLGERATPRNWRSCTPRRSEGCLTAAFASSRPIVGIMCSMLTVVISVLSTLIATAIVGALALVGRARTEVARHERLVAYLGKDFRRWVSDRDRLLGHELRGITNTMAAGPTFGDLEAAELGGAKPGDEATRVASQLYSGAHVRALAEAKRRALHEYRDEAERKLREFEALVEGEGWLHRFVRRRRGSARRGSSSLVRAETSSPTGASPRRIRPMPRRRPWRLTTRPGGSLSPSSRGLSRGRRLTTRNAFDGAPHGCRRRAAAPVEQESVV